MRLPHIICIICHVARWSYLAGMQPNRQQMRATPEQKRSLGRLIAGARVGLGLEQDDLARRIGRSQEWVSRVERGTTILSAFEYARLADILKIEPDAIRKIAWMSIERPQE